MKLTTLILIVSLFQLQANDTYGQKTKITLDLENVSLEQVFNKIESLTEFKFIYKDSEVDYRGTTSIRANREQIASVLERLFKGSNVDYRIMDKQIILRSGKEPIALKSTTDKVSTNIAAPLVQQITVSGTVADQDGQPLPGASIVEKGTTNGTQTDFDGNFSIQLANENAVLVVSYVGFATKEIAVNGQSNISISLAEDAAGLDEVVVVGYGTMKKSDLTGAVSSVNIEKLSEIPNVSPIQAMQGTVAGLNVGAVDQAGANPSFSIRGQNTLSNSAGDNEPLIVVDGIVFRGNLVDLNTADIESIDVLKDASSAAIYGSQASNGVIIITTKKGKRSERSVINYSSSFTSQSPSNKLEPMAGPELERFLKDTFWDQGSRIGPDYIEEDPNFSIIPFLRNARIAENYEAGLENNWWDLLTRNGSIANYNLSLSGGGERVKYFVSGGLTDVKGFMVNEDYKRYNYRINIDAKVNDWINVGAETFLTTSDYSGVSPNISNAFVMYPWAPIYDKNGEYELTPDSRGLNPFLEIQQDDSDKRMNLFANLHADIKLPFIKGFNYRLNYSQNYMTTNQDRFNPWGANYTGSGYKNSYINYDWTLDNIISYEYEFDSRNKINATLVYGVEERNYSFTKASAQNFINDNLGFNRLQAGDPALNTLSSGKEKENSLYSMARLYYNRSDKYLLTGTIRRDGFSGFGSKSKIGYFPSMALGWVISNEDFFEQIKSINYLKLRASYGISGRRAAGRYATQPIVNSGPSYAFGDGSGSEQGQFITSLANDNLGWETTKGYNFGIDFGAFNSRINGNIEYYDNNTKDILYDVQLPTLTGFSSIATNIGKVHNWGLEFNLNANVIKNQNFSWQSGVVFSRNRNKVVSILGVGNDQDGDGIEDNLIANNLFIGEPQNVNYNYNVIGMWQLSDQEAGNIPSGFLPGTYKLEDIDGDGSITASNDRKILGYQDPSFRMGWSNTISYGNLSMYVFVNTIQGGKNYYQANTGFRQNEWHKLDQLIYSTPPKGGWDYWMPENPNAKYRRPDTPSQLGLNTGPHQQRDFIRLQDVSIAYNLDAELIKKFGLSNFKIFLSGKNLFTWTKWEGWDPETGSGFSPGRPVMTNYTLGLNFEL